jgi:uncharacterized protein (TIGR02466 family)
MRLHNLFPTPVFETQFEPSNRLEIVRYIQNISATQSIGDLHKQDAFNELTFHIRNFAQECFNEMLWVDVNPVICSMWCNRLPAQSGLKKHFHPNSLLSGVWYPDYVNSPIIFYGQQQWMMYPKTKEQNDINSIAKAMMGVRGTCLIFPSYLQHEATNWNEDDRLSVSFNIFADGMFGDTTELTNLNIKVKE